MVGNNICVGGEFNDYLSIQSTVTNACYLAKTKIAYYTKRATETWMALSWAFVLSKFIEIFQ
jgi:hypothetical protein